jgi:AcrR family transcriptional regulator
MGAAHAPRGDTRKRIQDVALELFVERGYEGTSLREIAERLDVTKAALYYHFKTKEDILVALAQSYSGPLDRLIEWGKGRPRTLQTRRDLLKGYSEAVAYATPLFTFLYENQAALRELTIGQELREKLRMVRELFVDPEAELPEQARCISALLTVHFGGFSMREWPGGDPEVNRLALLKVADEVLCGQS